MTDDGLMGARAAAERLGVHENTIRNWVARGLILPAATLPGSGYCRFDRADIERMRAEMWSQFAPATELPEQLEPPAMTDEPIMDWDGYRDWFAPDPSLLLFLPAHRQALCHHARYSPTAAATLRALVVRAPIHFRRNAHWVALLSVAWRAYLLAPPPILLDMGEPIG